MKEKAIDKTPTRDEANDYFNYNASTGRMSGFTNADLVCRDCKYRLESVIRCKKYDEKPGAVIYCKPCAKYEKE